MFLFINFSFIDVSKLHLIDYDRPNRGNGNYMVSGAHFSFKSIIFWAWQLWQQALFLMHWKSVLDHFVGDQVTIPEAFFVWVSVQLSQFPVHESPFSRLLQLIKLGTVTILWVERVCSESEDEQPTLNVKKSNWDVVRLCYREKTSRQCTF